MKPLVRRVLIGGFFAARLLRVLSVKDLRPHGRTDVAAHVGVLRHGRLGVTEVIGDGPDAQSGIVEPSRLRPPERMGRHPSEPLGIHAGQHFLDVPAGVARIVYATDQAGKQQADLSGPVSGCPCRWSLRS